MKVCSRCYTEMNDQIKACPNCGQVMQAPNRPRLPFGFKVRGEAPVGAEMFHGFAVTELKAGDEFREVFEKKSNSIQLFRGSTRIWLWRDGGWKMAFIDPDFEENDDWINTFAASHGFGVEKESRASRAIGNKSCWRLK